MLHNNFSKGSLLYTNLPSLFYSFSYFYFFLNFFIQFTHTHIKYYLLHYITRKNRHSIFCLVDFYPHVFVPIHIHWAFNVKNSWLHDLLNQKLCFSNKQKKIVFFFFRRFFKEKGVIITIPVFSLLL